MAVTHESLPVALSNYWILLSSIHPNLTPVSLALNTNHFFFLPHLLQIMLGFGRLQALYRSRQLAKQYETTRARVIKFQAACRGYLIRQKIVTWKKAVCLIQAQCKGRVCLPNFAKDEEGGMRICPDASWISCCFYEVLRVNDQQALPLDSTEYWY